MQRIVSIILCLAAMTGASAQEDFEAIKARMQAGFNSFQQQAEDDFTAFRRKANDDYARFLEQAWQQMEAMAPIPASAKPKPRFVPEYDNQPHNPIHVDVDEVASIKVTEEDVDDPEIVLPTSMETSSEEVNFFATKTVMKVARDLSDLRLGSTAEKAIASAWKQLANGDYDPLLKDCLLQRRGMKLCDWAYIQFCQSAASTTMRGRHNETVLLQAFLLTQSGYRVRLAESRGQLVLLMPFDHTVYNYAYLNIDGTKYYVLDGNKQSEYRVCRAAFPRERTASIAINHLPQLVMQATPARTFVGGRYPGMKVTLGTNRNLIDFFSNYPLSDAWGSYALSSLSDEMKKTLYPVLYKQIEGKSKAKAVDMLLDFVQHAFDYQTDQEQFGYERPLFGEESFYYPYNDCEDRSILFSILVRELLGLDVVLLNYPGHLATAVYLDDSAKGDYIMVKGKRYIICDPTYIGACIGESMPQFTNTKAKVIVIGKRK